MKITYQVNTVPDASQIIEVFNSSGINRPTTDQERIKKMFSNSNLVITAWEESKLVAVSRALTDFCYCCYLSDIAVRKEYQHSGVGKKLIELTRDNIGDKASLILLSSASAMGYYPKIGFQKIDNGFIIKRTK